MSNITQKPIKASAVDMGKIKYSKVNSLPSGAKTLYVNHGDGVSPLFVQSPELTVPFDTGTFYPDNDGSGKYAIKVSMDNIESNPQMKEFHDMLVKMDEQILQDGISNSLAWFKKKNPNEDVIRELYTPMVKVSRDPETGEPNGKWAPSFAFKIVKRDHKVLCDVYDSDKKAITTTGEGAVDLEQMFKKGAKLKMILKCNGLWIASGKFGCTWRAEQIKIDAPAGFSGYAFEDSDDEDSGVELSRQQSKVVSPKEEVVTEVVPKADNYVEDDESESESDSEDDGAGVEPKSVKRMVKKA
jgi:hypothetical protein